MNKKRYIPLVVIGALILSLIAVLPTFGAGEVSFIDPNDIGADNNGSLTDPTPDTQEYGRQGGEVGLFIEDSSLNVPVRRVLLPSRDMTQPEFDANYDGDTDDNAVDGMLPEDLSVVTKAHEAEVMALVGHDVVADDYLVIGNHNVRKVVKVEAVLPTATLGAGTAASPHRWFVVRPDADDDANPMVTPIAKSIEISSIGGTATVNNLRATDDITVTATITTGGALDAGDSLTFKVGGKTLTPLDASPVPVTGVKPGSDNKIAISLGESKFVEATLDTATPPAPTNITDRVVTFTVATTNRFASDGTTPANITQDVVLSLNYMSRDQLEQTVTLDKPFDVGSDDPDTSPAIESLMVYKILKNANGKWVTDVDGVSWSSNYGLYAIAYDRATGTDFTSNLIADSGIARGGNDAAGPTLSRENRLKGGTLSGPRITRDDALLATANGDATTAPTYTQITRINTGDDIVPPTAGRVVAWFIEKNDIPVRVRSQAHPANTTLVMQETGADTGKFSLKITAAKFGTGTGEINMPVKTTTLPQMPVNPRDVLTLAGAGSTGTLSIETTAPSFTSLLPAHNTAVKGDRPEVSAQVTDGDSGVKKADIRILFFIEEVGKSDRYVTVNPNTDGDIDEISNGFSVTGRMAGGDAPKDDATISWWVKASDNAGNVGYSDRVTADADGPDPCTAASDATIDVLADTVSCDPYVLLIDSTEPKLLRAETGRHWNSALQTGDSKDKTEYRVSKANRTSVMVVFDEYLDATSVSASDFEVNGATPDDANVYNVKVRDDTFDENPDYDKAKDPNETGTDSDGNKKYINGDGNSAIAGDSVLDVESKRGYVFLRLAAELKSSAEPKVELVGEVLDLAANEQDGGVDSAATDRIAPKLTVTIDEGTRPVTMDKVNLTITSDENIGTPSVMAYHVTKLKTDKDAAVQAKATSFVGDVKFVSGSEYTAVVSSGSAPDDGGLYTIHVMANDAAGGNKGTAGDMTKDIDVSDDTTAILFEHDEAIGPPDVDPHTDGANDTFKTDDPNVYIRIDFASEANEYDDQAGDNPDTTATETDFRLGDDLDTHHGVSIVSASLNGEDITSSIQSNSAGNIFLYKSPSPLTVGDHKLEVIAEDAAGNRHPLAQKATITIEERKPFSLKLNPGWNLISLPGEPADPDINVVIPADRTDITSVLAYDPTVPGLWLSASRGADGMFSGTLKNITASRGYWVETNTFTALPVNIPKQAVGQAITLPTIQLVKGWNMVPIVDVDGDFMLSPDSMKMPALGTPAMPNATPPVEATVGYFDGLEGVRAYTFNTITNRWELASKAGGMVELGKGYWVYVTKSGIIVP